MDETGIFDMVNSLDIRDGKRGSINWYIGKNVKNRGF
jgi:hypothetical protein